MDKFSCLSQVIVIPVGYSASKIDQESEKHGTSAHAWTFASAHQ